MLFRVRSLPIFAAMVAAWATMTLMLCLCACVQTKLLYHAYHKLNMASCVVEGLPMAVSVHGDVRDKILRIRNSPKDVRLVMLLETCARKAEYDIASLFMASVYCVVTKACARRPGAAASVERRRRERRSLLAVRGRRASRSDTLATSQAFERMHIL
jgi:hypothetical protein